MCEASTSYVWNLDDRLGSGATSYVYKAYNMKQGTLVAAKVSKVERRGAHLIRMSPDDPRPPSIFDREIKFLKDIDHPNIIRFIGLETVSLRNDTPLTQSREVLFLEFCNGGSLTDVLQRPANRFGLPENTILQIMKDVTSGLKYLYQYKIIHRDIKPDNILQSIDLNGKITYKLADLGVARRINTDEFSSDTICGTVEFVNPKVFSAYRNGKKGKHRPQFLFEVEMWSFGVTLYQCATGRLPFLPYEGTRADQDTMEHILNSIPPGHISGVQLTPKGEIQWSKTLPEWCRLSSNLKEMLEYLLARLFETDDNKLMKHEEFFDEIEKILSFIPIYYLNLKRLTSTCTYIHKDQPINKLIDQIREENGDDENVEYFCLFQNVHYPISKTDDISVKTFYEQLPVEPSVDKLLVIYTYSTIQFDSKTPPKVKIPDVQPMKNIRDKFYSVYEWSKDTIGHFFYVKNQLMEYEFILQTTQSSIRTINRSLKTKLFQLLCSIRNDLTEYQAIYELDQIAHLMTIVDTISVENDQTVEETNSKKLRESIVKSDDGINTLNQDVQNALRSSIDFYRKLKEYDSDLSNISQEYFDEQFKSTEDNETPFDTYQVLKRIATFSKYIRQADEYISRALDLNDQFRRDTLMDRPVALHLLSHSIRKLNLTDIQKQFAQLVLQECYPIIVEVFSKYGHWIQLQAKINSDIESIQVSYRNQSNKIVPVDDLRRIVSDHLQKLNTMNQSATSMYTSIDIPLKPSFYDENMNEQNRVAIRNVAVTIQKAIKEAQTNTIQMNETIRQLQQLLRRR